jgi:ribosomal protein L24E
MNRKIEVRRDVQLFWNADKFCIRPLFDLHPQPFSHEWEKEAGFASSSLLAQIWERRVGEVRAK